MRALRERGMRSYISEPEPGARAQVRSRAAEREPSMRIVGGSGVRGKRLLARRGERSERNFAHSSTVAVVNPRTQPGTVSQRVIQHARLGLATPKLAGFDAELLD